MPRKTRRPSLRQSLALIRAAGAAPAGVVIALDRQERGQGAHSAAQELTHDEGVPVLAIVGLAEVVDYVLMQPDMANISAALTAYRSRYGAG